MDGDVETGETAVEQALVRAENLNSAASARLNLITVGEVWLFPVLVGMYEFEHFSWEDVLQHKEGGRPDGAMPNFTRSYYPNASG